MAQITNGIRAILSSPSVYNALQTFMGARRGRRVLVSDFLRPWPAMNVLDIGCGTAEILGYLPKVNYWGFDISESYIDRAKCSYGSKGKFCTKQITVDDLVELPPFDLVMAIGLLHHLNDSSAIDLLGVARRALRIGGRLVTVDPCLELGQSRIARCLIRYDRGQNVRTRSGYAAVISQVFAEHRTEVRHRTWIPYTHCYTECTRT